MSHYIDRRGERKVANNGLMMEIVAYRGKEDIDIKFLKDGYTVTHKSYNHFQQGCVRHPKYTVVGGFKENQETKPGEQNVNTTGQLMTIKEYNGYNDVVVEFENGGIAHTTYRSFKRGYVKNPLKTENTATYNAKKKYMNKVVPCKAGGTMKCVDYVDNNNLTVEFEDGTRVVTNASQFKEGTVKNPNILKNKYIGFETYSTCGLKMKCIKCDKTSEVVIEFEDETIVEHKTAKNLLNGKIPHPAFNSAGNAIQVFQAGDYIIKGLAYKNPLTGEGEFYCYKKSSPDNIEIKNINEMRKEYKGNNFFPCKFTEAKRTVTTWTEEDTKKLLDLYLTTDIDDLVKMFPGRSADAIKRRASYYGLHKERKHTYAKRRNKTV